MSKHAVRGAMSPGCWSALRNFGRKRGADGEGLPFRRHPGGWSRRFWIDRVLRKERIESHVVDPASITTSRRRRQAKTDRIDGEALVCALLAYKRGEPRVCAMVKAPTPRKRTAVASVASASADRRTGPARQSRQGAAVLTGISATSRYATTAGAAGYAPYRRWSPTTGSFEGAGSP